MFDRRIKVFGTAYHTGLEADPAVCEERLILEPEFKSNLLAYIDRFWTSAEVCDGLGLAPSRGVLFLGVPGTGKTQAVKHLLGRYPAVRKYYFLSDLVGQRGGGGDGFGDMVRSVSAWDTPAIAVVEDIDRLLEDGAISRQFLLNVLDGVLRPRSPVLWIATSNDPTGLDSSLLDRPGRFDRTFLFPKPKHR